MSNLYGKYRGEVFDIKDPKKMGRVRLKIPSVLGDKVSAWAIPCIPFSSDFKGFELNDIVWVEFEEGHIDKPVIVGTWWAERKTPIEELNSNYNSELKRRRIKTKKGHIIDLVDEDGEESIEIKDLKGNIIKIDSTIDTITIESSNKIIISSNNISLIANIISLTANQITLDGEVEITKNLNVVGNINAGGSIIDITGNTNHHSH